MRSSPDTGDGFGHDLPAAKSEHQWAKEQLRILLKKISSADFTGDADGWNKTDLRMDSLRRRDNQPGRTSRARPLTHLFDELIPHKELPQASRPSRPSRLRG